MNGVFFLYKFNWLSIWGCCERCLHTTQLDLKRCSYGLLLTRHISAPYILSHYRFSLLGFYNKSCCPFGEGSAEACRTWGKRGTVNTRHGSSFKVMNSNESTTGRLLRDKKSIWPPGCTSFSHAAPQAWLSGDVPLNIICGQLSPSAWLQPKAHSVKFCGGRILFSPWCDLKAL